MNPLVSVIIPVYNAEPFIKETIESVLIQTYQFFELIIIDDGSTDDSANIIHSIKDTRIKYVYQNNASQAVARNNGIHLAQGEFIAFLDHDDIWAFNKLEIQIKLFNNINIGLVYTGRTNINSDGKELNNQPIRSFFKGNVLENLLTGNFLFPSSVMIKKNILTDNNIYFRKNRQACEDYDLWLRLSMLTEFNFTTKKLAKYRLLKTSNSKNYHLMFNSSSITLNDIRCELKEKYTGKQLKILLRICKKNLASVNLSYAHNLLLYKKRKEAKKYYRNAFILTPFNLHTIWGALKGYIFY